MNNRCENCYEIQKDFRDKIDELRSMMLSRDGQLTKEINNKVTMTMFRWVVSGFISLIILAAGGVFATYSQTQKTLASIEKQTAVIVVEQKNMQENIKNHLVRP